MEQLEREKNMLLDNCINLRSQISDLEAKAAKDGSGNYGSRIETLEKQVGNLANSLERWAVQVK